MSWTTVKLAEIASIERDQIDPATLESGAAYLGLEHIEAGGRIIEARQVQRGDLLSTKFRFTKEHILYGKLRPYLAKISLPDFDGICSTDILPLRPRATVDRRFLAYFLRQPEMIELANLRTTGANLPRLSPKALADFDVPFPPIAQQRRIAAILDKGDSIRRKREQAYGLSDECLKSYFQRMFFAADKNWPSAKMSDVAELINGDRSSNYPGGDDIVDQGILFVNTKNIVGSKLSLHTKTFITQKKFDSLTRGKLRRGDLIVTLRGSVGQCALFDSEYDTGFINAQLMILRPLEKVLASYLLHLFIHPTLQNELLSSQSGSAVPQLTGGQIGQLEIPLPPISVQEHFSQIATKIGILQSKQRQDSDQAAGLFSSLCQRAFHGEL